MIWFFLYVYLSFYWYLLRRLDSPIEKSCMLVKISYYWHISKLWILFYSSILFIILCSHCLNLWFLCSKISNENTQYFWPYSLFLTLFWLFWAHYNAIWLRISLLIFIELSAVLVGIVGQFGDYCDFNNIKSSDL